MSVTSKPANLSVGQFAERYRREMIPLRKPFSYYFDSRLPHTEEDIREYLEEPVAALPPSVMTLLPKVSILLVPYLEKGIGSGETVRSEKPTRNRSSSTSCVLSKGEAVLAFALKDQEVADYHYRFYHLLGELVADGRTEDARRQYAALLREEQDGSIHGEADELSWELKQGLPDRKVPAGKDSKAFSIYARQSFIDTLTLYLHGICCDIDVDPGPRQLPSRYMRKRLTLLQSLYPPPVGYAVFPEDMKAK